MINIIKNIFKKQEENKTPIITKVEFPIRVYRLKRDYYLFWNGFKYKKGRVFIQWRGKYNREQTQLLATPIDSHSWGGGYSSLLNEMKYNNQIEEIELTELTKFKSHWNKELYSVLEKFKISI